jgi:hypothetical protein
MPISAAARLMIPAVAGAWTGLAAAVAAAGMFADTSLPFPWIGAFVAFPLVAVSGAAVLFPAVRSALLGIPLPTLVGLNIARVLGAFFILLAWSNRMGGPCPQSAGWGDIVTGGAGGCGNATRRTGKRKRRSCSLDVERVWRVGSVRRACASGDVGEWRAVAAHPCRRRVGRGADAAVVTHPSVLVPFYLITHGIILAQLLARRAHAYSPTHAATEAA